MSLSQSIKALFAESERVPSASSGGSLANSPSKNRAPSLLSDESGATMVMGIFMAAMLVGMIYYVWGIGGMVVHRERLQDAADTAAFGAAVIEARGMNLISILNVIMLVLAIIGTAMQIVPYITGAAAVAAGIDCARLQPCVWCICCPACFDAFMHGLDTVDAIDAASDWEDRISSALRAMNTAAKAISRGAPIMGQGLVVAYGTDVYAPTTDVGVADILPGYSTLQVEDDEDYVCQLWPSPMTSEHNLLSAPAIFALGTAAATFIFAAQASWNENQWYWEGYIPGYALGWIIEYDTFCNGESFMRVVEDSWLGEEPFQVRAIMHGEPGFTWTTQGVAVANWGRTEGTDSILSAIPPDVANSIGFAQAEYYWECDEGDIKEEWLFAPRWRARLRRFSITSALSSIPYIGSITSLLDGLVIH